MLVDLLKASALAALAEMKVSPEEVQMFFGSRVWTVMQQLLTRKLVEMYGELKNPNTSDERLRHVQAAIAATEFFVWLEHYLKSTSQFDDVQGQLEDLDSPEQQAHVEEVESLVQGSLLEEPDGAG